MRIISSASLQAQVHKAILGLDEADLKRHLGIQRYKKAEMKLGLQRYLELALLFRMSGIGCMKAFWLVNKRASSNPEAFPSYQGFHKWMSRIGKLLLALLDMSLGQLGQRLGLVDSMKLPIGDCSRWIKSMGKDAGLGHSACGRYYGRKLHTLVDEQGVLLAYELGPGNVDDRAPLKEGMLDGHRGLVYGDKGYINSELRHKLMAKGIELWARPKANMGFDTQDSFDYCRQFEALRPRREMLRATAADARASSGRATRRTTGCQRSRTNHVWKGSTWPLSVTMIPI